MNSCQIRLPPSADWPDAAHRWDHGASRAQLENLAGIYVALPLRMAVTTLLRDTFVFVEGGANTEMELALHRGFMAANLTSPQLRFELPIGDSLNFAACCTTCSWQYGRAPKPMGCRCMHWDLPASSRRTPLDVGLRARRWRPDWARRGGRATHVSLPRSNQLGTSHTPCRSPNRRRRTYPPMRFSRPSLFYSRDGVGRGGERRRRCWIGVRFWCRSRSVRVFAGIAAHHDQRYARSA